VAALTNWLSKLSHFQQKQKAVNFILYLTDSKIALTAAMRHKQRIKVLLQANLFTISIIFFTLFKVCWIKISSLFRFLKSYRLFSYPLSLKQFHVEKIGCKNS